MALKNIFIVGAGAMGQGIAQIAATAGYTVTIRDLDQAYTEKGKANIVATLARLATKGKITEDDAKAIADRITATTSLDAVKDADMVIEAIIESVKAKGDVFKEIDALAKPECIFASNTSSISITEIAANTKRPDKFVGMHFFNPVPLMKLLELVKGYSTTQETIDIAEEFGKATNKVTIISEDKAGFIVNRMFDLMLNEACFLIEDGVGRPIDIDNGMKFGLNHPMGPCELMDMIGLDVLLAVMEVLYREYGDPKYRPSNLLKKMVRANKLGKKTGEGWYKYN